MRLFKNKWFARFASAEDIGDAALCKAIEDAERGLIDADLGGGVIKQRIAREGEGASGGFRSIVLYRRGKLAFFVFGFPKNRTANIRKDELKPSGRSPRKCSRSTTGRSRGWRRPRP